MKKLLLALILLISINGYAQEEEVVYYNITNVSYKTGMNKDEIIWSDWFSTEWNLRIDYYIEQQTITIIKEESDFYIINSFIDSLKYEDYIIKRFKATDRESNKVTLEFMIPIDNNCFFLLITDKKDNIVMYKIE